MEGFDEALMEDYVQYLQEHPECCLVPTADLPRDPRDNVGFLPRIYERIDGDTLQIKPKPTKKGGFHQQIRE